LLLLVGKTVPTDGADPILELASELVIFVKRPVLLLEARGMEVPAEGAWVVSCAVPFDGVAVPSAEEDVTATVDVLLV